MYRGMYRLVVASPLGSVEGLIRRRDKTRRDEMSKSWRCRHAFSLIVNSRWSWERQARKPKWNYEQIHTESSRLYWPSLSVQGHSR